MYKMSEEQLENRKVIEQKGTVRVANTKFLESLFEAFEEGYVPAPHKWKEDLPVIKSNRRRVALYKKGYEVPDVKGAEVSRVDYYRLAIEEEARNTGKAVEIEEVIPAEVEDVAPVEEEAVNLEEVLMALNSKEDMISFAKEHNLNYTEDDAKYPKKLQKVLKAQL